MVMERAVILTGGNLGDVARTLERARRMVAEQVGEVVGFSSVMESEAWGFEAREKFLNQVLVCETELEPEALLDALQDIETRLGRRRGGGAETDAEMGGDTKAGTSGGVEAGERVYRSRPIDMDILFYGGRVVDTPRLTIPHPLIGQREFVLRPLCAVVPDLVHPVSGDSVSTMLRKFYAAQDDKRVAMGTGG